MWWFSSRGGLPRAWRLVESHGNLGSRSGRRSATRSGLKNPSGRARGLRFVTEGVLTRRLLSDPNLKGVDAVVLDEFHERHLESDLALALLKRLQRARPDLLIVVMSATLDADSVAQYLDGCPIIRSEGKLFELSIEHLPYSPQPLEKQVRSAVEQLINAQTSGDILAFLPGAAEIRRAMRECDVIARRNRTSGAAAARQSAAQRTGPGALSRLSTQTDSLDQRR